MKLRARLALSALALLASAAPAAASPQAAGWRGYGRGLDRSYPAPSAYARPVARGTRWSGYGVPNCEPRSVRVWVPGRWVVEERRVWVPGRRERVWSPPLFETRFDACGRSFRFQVRPGGFRTVQQPGRWETRAERAWRPAHWELRR